MGINLKDCIDNNFDRFKKRVYEKISSNADKLVKNAKKLELKYGIPIVNKRISITPVSLIMETHCKKEKFIELFGFGKWILGSSILVFIVNQGDDIFVGKMLGAAALGFYQMAYLISNLPATEITNVISQITFPTYSKIQDDLERLKKAYLEIFKTTMLISFPIAGGIIVFGSDFTVLFLGDKWMPMVTAMQVLALWGLIRSSGGLVAPLFRAINRPEIPTKILTLKLILLAILIYPLTIKWGILGTAWAVLINALFINPIAHYISIRMVGGKIIDILKVISGPAIGTLIMIIIIEIIKFLIKSAPKLEIFIALVIIANAIYFICLLLIDRQSILDKFSFFLNNTFDSKNLE